MSLCKPHNMGPECIICQRDAYKAFAEVLKKGLREIQTLGGPAALKATSTLSEAANSPRVFTSPPKKEDSTALELKRVYASLLELTKRVNVLEGKDPYDGMV